MRKGGVGSGGKGRIRGEGVGKAGEGMERGMGRREKRKGEGGKGQTGGEEESRVAFRQMKIYEYTPGQATI